LFCLILNLLHHVLELLVSVPLLEHVEEASSVLLPSKNLLVLLVVSLLLFIPLLLFHEFQFFLGFLASLVAAN